MKTLIISVLLLASNAFSQARYCDAVVTATAHEWGLELTITSAASDVTDCLYGVSVVPKDSTQPKLSWLLSRNEPSPARFLFDNSCNYVGAQLICAIGLKPGTSATVLGVVLGVGSERGAGTNASNCFTASTHNNGFFSGAVGLQQRPIRTICLPE